MPVYCVKIRDVINLPHWTQKL